MVSKIVNKRKLITCFDMVSMNLLGKLVWDYFLLAKLADC